MIPLALLLLSQAPQKDVEIAIGPIVAPARITGMGGAYASIAEGIGAALLNPAAAANRYTYNSDRFFDWDWDLDWLIVSGSGGGIAIEGVRGPHGDDRLSIVSGAIGMNLGRLGFGLSLESETVEVSGVRAGTTLGGLSIGYAFFDAALVIGLSLRTALITVTEASSTAELSRLTGGGLQLGAVWRPKDAPYRFGLSVLGPSTLGASSMPAVARAPGAPPPIQRAAVPLQLVAGVSYTLATRLNPPITTSSAAARALPIDPELRRYVTIAADLILLGTDHDSVSFASWAIDRPRAAGESVSLGVRVGLDSEFWPDRMRGRAGFYYEPSRFSDGEGRIHITAGLDLHLFELVFDWRVTAGLDLAQRYTNSILSIGFWH